MCYSYDAEKMKLMDSGWGIPALLFVGWTLDLSLVRSEQCVRCSIIVVSSLSLEKCNAMCCNDEIRSCIRVDGIENRAEGGNFGL